MPTEDNPCPMVPHMSAALHIRWILAVFLLPVLVPSLQGLSVKQLSQEQILSRAECVFVGTVTGKRSRWRRPGEMTETIYTIRMDQPVHASGRVLASHQTGDLVELAFAGGTVDGYTIWIPGVPAFEIGKRAVFFCDKDGTRHLSALVGTFQGVVPVSSGVPTNQRQTASLPAEDSGCVPVRRSFYSPTADHPSGQNLAEYIEDIRRALKVVNTEPPKRSPATAVADGYGGCGCSAPKTEALRSPHYSIKSEWVIPSGSIPLIWDLAPIIAYQDGRFASEFRKSMFDWNRYAGLYGWEDSGSADFGKLNFHNDVVITTQSVLQDKWGVQDFGDNLTLAFVAFGFNGALTSVLDVDIIYNASKSWTADFDDAVTDDTKEYFRSTTIHELGHAFGQEHQFLTDPPYRGLPSVMNYFLNEDRPLMSHPFLDDVLAIRSTYPNDVNPLDDLAVYFFKTSDNQRTDDGGDVIGIDLEYFNTSFTDVFPGGTIFVDALLENLGTRPISPKLTFWLSHSRHKLDRPILLGPLDLTELPPSSFAFLERESFRVPEDPSLIGNKYYLIAKVENRDSYLGNNIATMLKGSLTVESPASIVWDHSVWAPPSPQNQAVSPGEKKIVRGQIKFYHSGPANSVRWSIRSSSQQVFPVGTGGYLKKSTGAPRNWAVADYWLDASSLTPAGSPYQRTMTLEVEPGPSIEIPVTIYVSQPELDFKPAPDSPVGNGVQRFEL